MLRDFGRAVVFGLGCWLVAVGFVAVFGVDNAPTVRARIAEITALMGFGAWCGAMWKNPENVGTNVVRALCLYACMWAMYGMLYLLGSDLSKLLALPATFVVGLHLGVGFFWGCTGPKKKRRYGSGC